MAPVVSALKLTLGIRATICVTAQHREMLDQALRLFSITPDYDLDLMREHQDLTDITASVLQALRPLLRREKPDLVLVHGDTTTTLSASLAAYYERISVGHVEAGLRTRDIYGPWPEEVNRRATAAIAALHFAPTERARQNLLDESVKPSNIYVTGNTIVDALHRITRSNRYTIEGLKQLSFLDESQKLILVTGHRRESFGSGFRNLCGALRGLASRGDVQIVYPVHPNPDIHDTIYAELGKCSNIFLIPPLDYFTFVALMHRSYIILTDSGGVQEEAPSLGKPVLVLRDRTERPEAIDAGVARLVGTDRIRIYDAAAELLDDPSAYDAMSHTRNPYGDGRAALRIAKIIADRFG